MRVRLRAVVVGDVGVIAAKYQRNLFQLFHLKIYSFLGLRPHELYS